MQQLWEKIFGLENKRAVTVETTPPSVKSAGPAVTSFIAYCSNSITRPLTTVFTPPASCLNDIFLVGTKYQYAPYYRSDCYPSSIYAVFSPGLCPTGYTLALGQANVYSSCSTGGSITESQYLCCPSGMTFNPGSIICVTTLNTPSVTGNPPRLVTASVPFSVTEVVLPVTFGITTTSDSGAGTSTFSSTASLRTTQLATTDPLTVYAPAFYVRFQSTDSEIASIWASIISQSSNNGQNSTSTNTTASAASATSSLGAGTSSSISSGAIAGIVIGALAALAALIAGVFLLLRKRRAQRAPIVSSQEGEGDVKEPAWTKQELSGEPVARAELDDQKEIKELATEQPAPVELHGDHIPREPQELDTSRFE